VDGEEAARVLQGRAAARIADLRERAVKAELRVVRSFGDQGKIQLLGLARAAGVQVRECDLALLSGVWLQSATA